MALLAIRSVFGFIFVILVLADGSHAQEVDLPPKAPQPGPSPFAPININRPPLPSPRPEPVLLPDNPLAPAERPKTEELGRTTPTVPTDELGCRARLRALGVDFSDRSQINEPPGCLVAHPVMIKSLGKNISIAPDALLNCATAEAMAHFLADIVIPAAKSIFGEDLVSVANGSAFVCRPRNGTTKLSEHAFGNALDIGAFKLASGRIVNVAAATDPREADFLSKVRMAACGPFSTVLGPGTDADHALHFHFDLAKRRNGSAYCR